MATRKTVAETKVGYLAESLAMVLVIWEDSAGPSEGRTWYEVSEAASIRPEIMETVGYVIAEGPGHLVIASTTDSKLMERPRGDRMCAHPLSIPRSAIREIRELATGKRVVG